MIAYMLCVALQYWVFQIVHSQNESSPCPVWMIFESNQCTCRYRNRLFCMNHSLVIKETPYCVSYDSEFRQLVTGYCPYSYHQIDYMKHLNSTVSYDQFNEVVCGPLKRRGRLCSRCVPGYGIPVFSKATDECVSCDSKYSWPLYLALVLLPITLLYFLVIVFNFSATRPPITAYMFYCQLFIQVVYNISYVKHYFDMNTTKVFQNITWTVTAVWNLDMLRNIIPSFCLKESFTNIDAIQLELIGALYPIFLIIVTLLLIEMHSNNIKAVVLLWKPFQRCFTLVRRAWDPKSSVTNAFATFLLLSSFKVCFITFNIMKTAKLYLQDGNGSFHVLYYDPTILDNGIMQKFIFLLLLSFLAVIIPIILLALYPTRLFMRLISKLPVRVQSAIHMFMDCFQGHYKDGTTGTYDYRSVSSLGFALRLLVGVMLASPWSNAGFKNNNGDLTFVAFLLIAVSLFYAHVRPCKRQYMNVIESLLYCTAGLLLIAIIHNNHFPPLYDIILAAILMPSIVFVGIVMYKVLDVFGIVRKTKTTYSSLRGGAGYNSDGNEAEPHRLTHPTQYTPLLK